jgi:hypothetical protein
LDEAAISHPETNYGFEYTTYFAVTQSHNACRLAGAAAT